MLLFSCLVSAGAGLLAGSVPAFVVSPRDLAGSLKGAGRSASGHPPGRLLGAGLVAAQLALALPLSIGAGLMLESVSRLAAVDPGFETVHGLTFRVTLPRYRFTGDARWNETVESLLARLETLPGVRASGASSWTPLSGSWGRAQMSVEATSGEVMEREQWPMVFGVTPGYVRALGLPLLLGRDLRLEDGPGGTAVLVNRRLAERAWPGETPVGKRLKFGTADSDHPWLTVVGVVEDARLVGLAQESQEGLLRPILRTGRTLSDLQVFVRTSVDPESLMPAVRETIWAVDQELPIAEVRTLEDLVAGNVSRPRFLLLVIALFAATASVLAGIGTWGVVSRSVSRRTREMGIRMALGADRRAVLGLVLRRAMSVVALGVGVGLGLALVSTRVLASFLYQVSATEAATFANAAAILGAVGLLAAIGPAWRASRVDPIAVLKVD